MTHAQLDRWKEAVVHLECATDSVHFYDRTRQWDELRERHQRGEITPGQLSEGILASSRDIRFNGTALFVRHADRRFLVTARHVLWDEFSAKRELKEEQDRAQGWPENMRQDLVARAVERSLTQIFSIIFRVPTLDEVLPPSSGRPNEFLMNLGAGTPWTVPYTFSDPELDLAVVSLEQRDKRFAEELERQGYRAISSQEFSENPSSEGAEVFTVGFPRATAILGERALHPALAHWSSNAVCVPTFAFGKVSMLHPNLEFFWCDMSIYPGNSGGPVIEGDKLVGIVSAQPAIPIEGKALSGAATRIPFAKAIKAKHLVPVLNEQLKKDSARST